MKKRILSLVLAVVMVCALAPVVAWAATSGTCGDNLTWTLDDDGTLTISGEGEMWDWIYYYPAPWHDYSSDIISVEISNGVTSVGNSAFYYCTNLMGITLPDSITNIGENAFYRCTSLTYINIPDNITSIGSCAFSSCSGLTEITIPNSVTNIGYGAFSNCTELTNIMISDGAISIDRYAFSGTAYYNNSDNWENGVLYIGNYLIKAKPEEIGSEYNIKSSTMGIAASAFEICEKLTKIILPNSITNIGDYAFNCCTALTSTNIPDSVTSIGSGTFKNCKKLTKIILPNSVTHIGSGAFDDTPYYDKNYNDISNWDGSVFYLDNWIFDADTSISGNYQVKEGTRGIAGSAFADCAGLTGIVLPDSLKGIGDNAFSYCIDLTDITLPDNLENIGGYAFFGCTELTSLVIPPSVAEIGDMAYGFFEYGQFFYGKGYMGYPVTLYGCIGSAAETYCYTANSTLCAPEITFVAYNADNNEASIEYCTPYDNGSSGVTILKSIDGCPLTEICTDAFAACGKLTEVYYEGSEEEWKSLTIGSGNENLLNAKIYYNSTMPPIVRKYNDFRYTISNGEVMIVKYFEGAENPVIPSEIEGMPVTEIGEGAFSSCEGIISVMIPNSVTNIGSSAFSYCTNLKSITIPNSITSIDDYSFYGCTSLTSIVIPDSVTSINSYAFDYCESLIDVYYTGTRSDWNNIIIEDNNDYLTKATLHTNAIDINPPRITNTSYVSAAASAPASIVVTLNDMEYNSEMITVFYKEGATVDMQTTPVSAGNSELTVPVTAADADAAKVFIWSSLDKMKPLCKAETVYLNNAK